MSSCCSPDGNCSSGGNGESLAGDSHLTVYHVAGMTCDHCKASVTKAIHTVNNVLAVEVDVASGHVTVTTGGAPDDTLIAKVVDDAGYELIGRV
ncbi:heavy-metal-associated domain-containing protein [Streptomyces sp. So13.3]|nr:MULTISPECIES: heavy-metal-associated domain-containing protein [unclassified Streptomyces]MCZ4101593.1 heavy-metal-associated domain-containing protein [Streptomyces sp. H39-C1]QNA78382.1 heavy-metal-associated domain-containing protein [Streptomyces sp. So13.3]